MTLSHSPFPERGPLGPRFFDYNSAGNEPTQQSDNSNFAQSISPLAFSFQMKAGPMRRILLLTLIAANAPSAPASRH